MMERVFLNQLLPGVLSPSTLPSIQSPMTACTGSSRLRVMTYNVLAQCLINRSFFPYASRSNLKKASRKERILKEIIHYGPDVALLQEVEDFPKFLQDLNDYNYAGVYEGPSELNKKGIAVLWKKDRISLVEHVGVNFNTAFDCNSHTLSDANLASIGYEATADIQRSMRDGNIGQVVSLQFHDNGEQQEKVIVVTNCHLYWKPGFDFVRLAQLRILAQEATKARHRHADSSLPPLLWGGDHNTTPYESVYHLLVGTHDTKWQTLVVDQALETLLNGDQVGIINRDSLVRDVAADAEVLSGLGQLQDAFSIAANRQYERGGNALVFTTYSKWQGTIDHLLTSSSLKPVSWLSMPSNSEVQPGLPNDIFPSDHISVAAEFEFHNVNEI